MPKETDWQELGRFEGIGETLIFDRDDKSGVYKVYLFVGGSERETIYYRGKNAEKANEMFVKQTHKVLNRIKREAKSPTRVNKLKGKKRSFV